MDTQDEIINKIRNIVRLARRAGTDGERTAAENAAQRLAAKHGIALETIEETDSEANAKVFEDAEFHVVPKMEAGYITHILREHFGIVLIQFRAIGDRKARLTWVGTAINVDIAKHVYTVLLRACRKDWGEARTARRKAQKTRIDFRTTSAERHAIVVLRKLSQRSFYDGWFAMIDKKLRENPLRNDLEQFNAEKKAAERKFAEMQKRDNINERKRESPENKTDRLSLELGIAAGSKINLNRPCEANGYEGPYRRIAL